MSPRTINLDDRLRDYLLEVGVREPDLLRRLREETAGYPLSRMQIAPEQGQFISLLLRLIGAHRTIEVGVYTGYSSLWSALALPGDGLLVACDINEEWTAVARRYWREAGVEGRIRLHLAPAAETLERLHADGEGPFDFAFIDADKENYGLYYEQCLRLLRPGGLLAFDNVFWGGTVADPTADDPETRALKRLNRALHDDPRVDLSMVPIGDGLTLLRKR